MSKYLIINADDFGLCHSANLAVEELFEGGWLKSSTIMTPCPGADEAIDFAKKNPQYNKISTQNKLNFISGIRDLSECTVYGLYVLFNSTMYDIYYRILNGSTQVNSTEINSMPVPSISIIESMGRDLLLIHDMSEASCYKILENYL